MAGYTKLFGSILDSSIWQEPPMTRLVWLTLLAMADRDGIVEASTNGIADRAKVPLLDAELALGCFMAPDPMSKNPANEGRRLERTTDGYRLLNYDFYRQKMSAEEMRAKNAERQRRYRERQGVTSDVTSRPVTSGHNSNDIASASASASQKAEAKAVRSDSAEPARTPTSPPAVLTFPVVGKDGPEWYLTAAQRDEWAALFPGVDVMLEAKAALAWCKANPAKRKTFGGMAAFLAKWLTKAQNQGGSSLVSARKAPESFQARDERERQERAHRQRDSFGEESARTVTPGRCARHLYRQTWGDCNRKCPEWKGAPDA